MTVVEQIRGLAAAGIGRRGVEATLGRALTEAERNEFERAVAVRKLKIAQKKARGPMSAAERVRKHVAAANDIPPIDAVRHPRLKEYCRYNLEAFGWYYCRSLLKHRASPAIRDGLIASIQSCVLNGGMSVKEYGRGTGKTTWCNDIATIWAVLYGHRRYVVNIAATSRQAKKNLKRIKKVIARSDAILADFPAVSVAIRALNGISQRAVSQTYHGRPTDIEWASDQIALPTLRDSSGALLDRGCGGIIAAIGIGGAIRGANEGGQRPDFLILDDPQTKKSAHSPSMVAGIIDYIHADALFLAGHDRAMSAFVTITPQCFGDVATELTSKSKHPEWSVSVEPFVSSVCPNWDSLANEYAQAYVEDMANGDYAQTRSRAWYIEHRDDFNGFQTLDPEQYDHEHEVDVVHHMLNLRAKNGEIVFNAEIMMQVADVASDIAINPDLVANAVNGYPRTELPAGTTDIVAFCDVNIKRGAGFSWAVTAFGPGRVAAVIDYGRYPENGEVVPPKSTATDKERAIRAAMNAVVQIIADTHYYRRVGDKRIRVKPIALAFDRGFAPREVTRGLKILRQKGYLPKGERVLSDGSFANYRPVPFNVLAVLGKRWQDFNSMKKREILRRGDSIYAAMSPQYGEYLAAKSPYWREIMQSAWLETPLMPGSLSLFGRSPSSHFKFAQEICNEKLVRKYVHPSGVLAWDYLDPPLGPEHFCDAVTGCFELASWFRCYDSLGQMIDTAAMIEAHPPKPVLHQDDLFDPRVNQALNGGEGYEPLAPSALASSPASLGDRNAAAPPADFPPYDPTEGTGVIIEPTDLPIPRHHFKMVTPLQPPPPRPPSIHRKSVIRRKGKIYVRA